MPAGKADAAGIRPRIIIFVPRFFTCPVTDRDIAVPAYSVFVPGKRCVASWGSGGAGLGISGVPGLSGEIPGSGFGGREGISGFSGTSSGSFGPEG